MTKTTLMKKWEELLRPSPKRIAMPELHDPRVLGASLELVRSGVVSKIVTCETKANSGETLDLAKGMGWTERETKFLECLQIDEIAPERIEMPRGEGFLRQSLQKLGAELKNGNVDALLAGAELTTADVARCAIKQIGLAQSVKTLSSGFLMADERHLLYFSDCGIVVDPTVDQLQEIAEGAALVYRKLTRNERPTIAFLSFSTKGSAKTSSSLKMSEAASVFASTHPDFPVIGEVQFDAAWDPLVFKKKTRTDANVQTPKLPADIFIFPEINSANISYKILQRVAGFQAYGPIIQGASRPICDLSRGSTVEDIFATALITLLQA